MSEKYPVIGDIIVSITPLRASMAAAEETDRRIHFIMVISGLPEEEVYAMGEIAANYAKTTPLRNDYVFFKLLDGIYNRFAAGYKHAQVLEWLNGGDHIYTDGDGTIKLRDLRDFAPPGVID